MTINQATNYAYQFGCIAYLTGHVLVIVDSYGHEHAFPILSNGHVPRRAIMRRIGD